MSAFKAGERLAMARTIVKLGGMSALLKNHPKVAESILERTLNRTVFSVSHNRMKSGPYAKRKSKANQARNKRIVTMATKTDHEGFYVHFYEDIAAEVDLSTNQVSKICREAGLRRACEKGLTA
jgi:Cu2+-containing amine oxidase